MKLTIKQLFCAFAAAALALTFTSCDNAAEDHADDKADQVRDAGENAADSIENKADAVRDTTENKADAIEDAAKNN